MRISDWSADVCSSDLARRTPGSELPLFAAARARELGVEPDMALPATPPSEEVVADYQTVRLSLKDHPLTFLRDHLREQGILSCADTQEAKSGAQVRSAGDRESTRLNSST